MTTRKPSPKSAPAAKRVRVAARSKAGRKPPSQTETGRRFAIALEFLREGGKEEYALQAVAERHGIRWTTVKAYVDKYRKLLREREALLRPMFRAKLPDGSEPAFVKALEEGYAIAIPGPVFGAPALLSPRKRRARSKPRQR